MAKKQPVHPMFSLTQRQQEHLAMYGQWDIVNMLVSNKMLTRDMSLVQMDEIIDGTLAMGATFSHVYANKKYGAHIMRMARAFMEKLGLNPMQTANLLNVYPWRDNQYPQLFVYMVVSMTLPNEAIANHLNYILFNAPTCADIYKSYFDRLCNCQINERNSLMDAITNTYINARNSFYHMKDAQRTYAMMSQVQQSETISKILNTEVDVDFSKLFT